MLIIKEIGDLDGKVQSEISLTESLFYSSIYSSQLYELTTLFSSGDIGDYISPLAFGLSVDKVADVRHAAIKAVSSH